MQILIVDDEALAREELSYLVKQSPAVSSPEISTAEDIHEAEDILLQKQIDLLFLDISLNDENGFDLAKKLQLLAKPPLVIFATAYDDYAVKAFEIEAVDYILKPFEEERVNQALTKVIRILAAKQEPAGAKLTPKTSKFITITIDEHSILLKKEQLVAASVENGTLTISTEEAEYQVKQTLAWIKKKLPEKNFIQIHRNTIINIDKIKEIQPWFNHTALVVTFNDLKLPVGRSYLKEFNQLLGL